MSVKSALIAAGVPRAIAEVEAPRAERAMREADITTQPRASAFLAQVLHESAGLRFFEEIASGAAYEGRKDLGNTQRGDGRRFKGRGPIQLTGRANYRAAGKALGLPLEEKPELAAQHGVGWRIAGWYWSTRGLNGIADGYSVDSFIALTKRINGGTNGLADRQRYWRIVREHDCRPGSGDPLAGYPADERRWIRELDAIRAGRMKPSHPRREEVLVDVMTRRRKSIWRVAEGDPAGRTAGWAKRERARRYRSLKARTA